MPLRNPYTISPTDITFGDIFVVTVTCHITPVGIRFYKCPYPNPDTADGIPQGGMLDPRSNLFDLFPSVKSWWEGAG